MGENNQNSEKSNNLRTKVATENENASADHKDGKRRMDLSTVHNEGASIQDETSQRSMDRDARTAIGKKH